MLSVSNPYFMSILNNDKGANSRLTPDLFFCTKGMALVHLCLINYGYIIIMCYNKEKVKYRGDIFYV